MIMAFPPNFEFARNEEEMKKYKDSPDGEGSHGKGHDGGKKVGMPDALAAQCHIFYERRVVDVKDGLPKWRGHKEKSEAMGEDERP